MPAYSHMGFFPCAWILSVRGITVALGLGILTTALAYCLVMAGLKNCDTAKAATLSLGEPLGAAVLGFAVLHEALNLWGFNRNSGDIRKRSYPCLSAGKEKYLIFAHFS